MSTEAARQRDDVFDEAFLRKLERLDLVARKLRAGTLRGEREAFVCLWDWSRFCPRGC